MKKNVRNILISIFVVCWVVLFHYESTRHFFLAPFFKKHFALDLSKTQWLFPPAGWIMFYQVDTQFGYADIYGIKNGATLRIDPHEIIETRTIGYDNIYRNILNSVIDRRRGPKFCQFLDRKFPYFDNFIVAYMEFPNLDKDRQERFHRIIYQCRP